MGQEALVEQNQISMPNLAATVLDVIKRWHEVHSGYSAEALA